MIAINAEMPKDCGKCFVGDRTLCSSGCPLVDISKEFRKETEKMNESKWIRDGHHIICDKCGATMCDTDREGDKIPTNFCPNCGEKMTDEDE